MPKTVVDVHGHIVAPAELYSYREFLIGSRGHYGRRDKVGTDVQLVSGRPYSLMHSEKPGRIVHWWAQAVNDAIATQTQFYPTRLFGIANLPQVWGEPISVTFEELDRCVNELGFVGALVNPDPSEGRAAADVPGLGDEYWYPLYEKLVEYDVPMSVHSCGCVSMRENQSLHFISEESTAVMSLAQSEVFDLFPTLKVIVPHGGGAIPYQLGRFRGTYWEGMGRTDTFDEAVRQMHFDTALYSDKALELLVSEIGADRIVLGTERPGDGSHKKSQEGIWADDIASALRRLPGANDADLDQMLGDNALGLFPRVVARLAEHAATATPVA
jgi:predicted TIM-barrel fold metal-dependent hydrolase